MAVLILLLLTACVTPFQSRQLLDSPPDIVAVTELTSAPFYPQRDYQCGPAALATVINHYQQQTSVEQLLPLVYIPELKGSLQVEMLAATKQFGRLAIQLDGRLQSILREVAAGNPVLVLQNLGLQAYPFWHYAVVIGYNLTTQQIILRSGEIKRLVRPFAVFERTWKRADYWSAVVVPADIMPVTVSAQSFINAVLGLEPAKNPQIPLLAYQKGVARWPQNFILQMGLGNSRYALANYAQAEQAFRAATRAAPTRAEAWNNLAYALLQQDRTTEAMQAIERAIQLQPQHDEYRNSKAEIMSHP